MPGIRTHHKPSAARPRDVLDELLDRNSVPRVLEALARVCELRASVVVPPHARLHPVGELAETIADTLRRLAASIERAEERLA